MGDLALQWIQGDFRSPIVCEIEAGYIREMTGGAQADVLRSDLESHNDRHCFNVA